MAEQLIDGTGTGFRVQVNSDNQLRTFATIETEAVFRNKAGFAYNLNTGLISLTDAVDTPIMYLKNNEEGDIIIEAVVIGAFNSTNGSSTADVYTTFIRNPTTGTIITSTPTNVDMNSNRNYSSTNTLTADVFKGATGDTMTDGNDHILVRLSTNSRTFVSINEVMPKGTSFGVKFKPPTSNTAMNVYAAIICYIHD